MSMSRRAFLTMAGSVAVAYAITKPAAPQPLAVRPTLDALLRDLTELSHDRRI